MTPHRFETDDGIWVACVCVHGEDHNEELFDVPREDTE